MSKIKVLIVDDSALIRKLLTEVLSSDSQIDVVGTANDPIIAREKIKQLNPDVLTLDVEMPKMDGVTFLRNLMRLRPMPVIMVSTLTEAGADVTLQALEAGAIDYVTKPKIDVAESFDEYAKEIIGKVKVAASANVSALERRHKKITVDPKQSADVILKKETGRINFKTTEKIVAIGASTGGTEAIKEVLMRLPADAPGIVITQHIPEAFSTPFAKRMNGISQMVVKEAEDGDQIIPGHVFIAPGSHHLYVERSGARYHCRLDDGPAVNRHKPAVDVLFRSVSQVAGPNSIGVLLTGMGDDGARGLKELQDIGAKTIAQDEKTSVVWGMPGSAVELGAADFVLPLEQVAKKIMSLYLKQ